MQSQVLEKNYLQVCVFAGWRPQEALNWQCVMAGLARAGEVTTGSHLHTIHTIHSPLQGFSLSSVCGLTGFQSRKLTRASIMADWRTYSLASEDSFPQKKTHFIIRRESKLRECHRVVGDGFREVPH